jgi:TRAP-type C4-dicarboxylate transport system substrate-binding protein
MWSNPASMQKTIDAGLWDLGISQKLEKHNLVVLGVAVGGPYQFYAKDFQVMAPSDVKGKKWGVSGSTMSKAIELMGGAPTTMSSGELYMALQRGTIDGTTRPLLTGLGRKLYEVVEHLSICNMAYYCSFLIINKDTWNSLPADVQEIMKKAAKARNQEQLAMLNAFLDEAAAKYRDMGVKVHRSSEEEIAAFRKMMTPVYEWWLAEVPDGRKYIEFAEKNK